MKQVAVENYNSSWPSMFEAIKAQVWPAVQDIAIGIEHVGSTSIPGLSAKPVIDIDVVILNASDLPMVIERLKAVGYEHRGNLGIEGREAFRAPAASIKQNFYVCLEDSLALKNHLLLRDHLRSNASARDEYSLLKHELARKFPDDIDSYVEGKTAFILRVLESQGILASELNDIDEANRNKNTMRAQLSHVAFLVSSVQKAAALPAGLDLTVGPAEKWEGEGTLEIYVGEDSYTGKLLLMEAVSDGAYQRALKKRGPGLHHIAVDVLNLEEYIGKLSGSGWFLHPKSLETIKQTKTAYLARPGMPTMIEVQERDTLSEKPSFISIFEMPFANDQMKLINALGVAELKRSHDGTYWLTCASQRFSANGLLSGR